MAVVAKFGCIPVDCGQNLQVSAGFGQTLPNIIQTWWNSGQNWLTWPEVGLVDYTFWKLRISPGAQGWFPGCAEQQPTIVGQYYSLSSGLVARNADLLIFASPLSVGGQAGPIRAPMPPDHTILCGCKPSGKAGEGASRRASRLAGMATRSKGHSAHPPSQDFLAVKLNTGSFSDRRACTAPPHVRARVSVLRALAVAFGSATPSGKSSVVGDPVPTFCIPWSCPPPGHTSGRRGPVRWCRMDGCSMGEGRPTDGGRASLFLAKPRAGRSELGSIGRDALGIGRLPEI